MWEMSFRPLLGFFISKSGNPWRENNPQKVFVPYWGSLFQNSIKSIIRTCLNKVFVPYWGSLFQNLKEVCYLFTLVEFSSPTGVLYFKMSNEI